MPPSYELWIDQWRRRNVLVLGEAILDSYLGGRSLRFAQEGPAPVVTDLQQRDAPGGAANTAANLRALGASVRLLSVAGGDDEGARLRTTLRACGVADAHVLSCPERRTLAKTRIIANDRLLARLDSGDTEAISRETEDRLLRRLDELVAECDAVVVSDYAYGVLTPTVIDRLAALRRSMEVLVVDARDLWPYAPVSPTAVTPNHHEATRLIGLPPATGAARVSQIEEHAGALLAHTGAGYVAVTLDRDGAVLLSGSQPPLHVPAHPCTGDTTGAGDTFTAALALGLSAGASPQGATTMAVAAASVAVGKPGTAICSASELREQMRRIAANGRTARCGPADSPSRRTDAEAILQDGPQLEKQKVVSSRAMLNVHLGRRRRLGQRIVFTNGCFDLLHGGHIALLEEARRRGDVLIVGLNTDASVRRLKGPDRPLNSCGDRARVLAALACVDLVVPFDEDTPEALIRVVRPHVFVKGGDYDRSRLPEAPLVESFGGTVEILSYVNGYSTTALVESIRTQRCPEPAMQGNPAV